MIAPVSSTLNPALVTQRAAQRLPRVALLLFCAAYLVPGLIGRDPWKNADITAFGYMLSIAKGTSAWLHPMLAGVPSDSGALLPYWIGAAFISVLQPLGVDPAFAARMPFALLLGVVMMLTWYSTFHLARTEAAQPLAFAFGGEAGAVDYARAIADGALLALIATLGLLQLGHETTPELVQLTGSALLLYGLAASPYRRSRARLAVVAALLTLSASGAPAIGMAMGLLGVAICRRSSYSQVRDLWTWVLGATLAGALLAAAVGVWAPRSDLRGALRDWTAVLRLLVWFLWPAWPLALWTVWRWRGQLLNRHITIPIGLSLVAILASIGMGGSDRALMLGVPALAVAASFALPTLKRSASAAIDWFSVFFFSICAITVWVVYVSMHAGIPAKPAANVARLAPGFTPTFSMLALIAAAAGTLAWLWLVRWRTARHRPALWKSLVLPAAGVALNWLLVMSLWLPVLDYARSYRPLMQRIARHVPPGSADCISGYGLPRAMLAGLTYFGRYRIDGARRPDSSGCSTWLRIEDKDRPLPVPAGWTLVARERRPTDREEVTAILRRAPAPPAAPG